MNKTLPTQYTFTGQYSYVADEATDLGSAGFGLLFYNARFYDPAIGRFISADSIVPGGVQGYDRYAYTNNNPVRYTDPTGHMMDDGCSIGCGGDSSNSNSNNNNDDIPDPDDDGGGGGGGGDEDDKSGGADEDLLPDVQSGNDCMQWGSQATCEVYMSSASAELLENISDPMAIVSEGLWLIVGTLIGMTGGGEFILVGVVAGFAAGTYESEVIHDIQDEFDQAGVGNAPLVITQPDDPNSYGVIVDGNNNGVGTVVNTPLAYLTLYLMLSNNP